MSTQDASARVADSSNISDTDEAQITSEGPHETREAHMRLFACVLGSSMFLTCSFGMSQLLVLLGAN